MISRALHWLSESGPVPHWLVCIGALCVFLAVIECAVVVTLWIEGKRYEKENS